MVSPSSSLEIKSSPVKEKPSMKKLPKSKKDKVETELQESTNPISAEESNGINHENDIIFQVPQAQSTVMNSEENSKNSSNASTLPPPVQSFQDVYLQYLKKSQEKMDQIKSECIQIHSSVHWQSNHYEPFTYYRNIYFVVLSVRS